MANDATYKRKSWKQQSARRPAAQGSSNGAKWLLTILMIGLAAFIGWYLWHVGTDSKLRTQFVTLAPGMTPRLSVSQVSPVEADTRLLGELDPESKHSIEFSPTNREGRSNTSHGVDVICDDLAKMSFKKNDVLVIYVGLHGVSHLGEDGSAMLLGRAFDLTNQSATRRLRTLLAAVAAAPAKERLVILDTGYVGYDPRLGVIANEFPRLVAERLAEMKPESPTWVLISNHPMQTNALAYDRQQSVFGAAVAEGIAAAADDESNGGSGDQQVSLGELYRYVAARCTVENRRDSAAATNEIGFAAGNAR